MLQEVGMRCCIFFFEGFGRTNKWDVEKRASKSLEDLREPDGQTGMLKNYCFVCKKQPLPQGSLWCFFFPYANLTERPSYPPSVYSDHRTTETHVFYLLYSIAVDLLTCLCNSRSKQWTRFQHLWMAPEITCMYLASTCWNSAMSTNVFLDGK